MQTRYLGDSHDFIKFALLRHVHSQCRLRLGVNWYLTRPENVDRKGSSDGEMRHHLTHPAWAGWDAELLDAVRGFEVSEHRTLAALEASGILPPDTLFFDEPVAQRDREGWHARATGALADADLVFLDPDNGMEVKPQSMTGSRKAKYAYYAELRSYYERKQAVIAIQFAGRSDPIERGQTVRTKLASHLERPVSLPIVRGRVTPNILFVALAPDGMATALDSALRSFGNSGPKVELIP